MSIIKKPAFCELIVIFIIFLSGNYFVMQEYSISVLSLFFVLIGYGALFCRKMFKSGEKASSFLLLMLVLLGLSVATNLSFNDIPSYIAIGLQMICSLLICNFISEKSFINNYINIMTALATISLVFWGISLMQPSIAHLFPLVRRDDLNLNYYNAGIYVFWEETGWGYKFLSKRNAGVFCEPGMYQAFLNIALFFEIDKGSNKSIKKIILLIVTIVTTCSTTGYVVLFIIYIMELKKKADKNKKLLLILIGLFIGVYLALNSNGTVSKLLDSEYLFDRISINSVLMMFGSVKNYFFGYSFSGRVKISSSLVWNSIIDSVFVFGFGFVYLLLRRYYIYCKNRWDNSTFFLVLLICFSVESLIWRPVFLCLVFYSFYPVLNKEKCDNECECGDKI